MIRVQDFEERAAASQNNGEMAGAPVVKAGGVSSASLILLASLHNPLVYPDAKPEVVRVVEDMASSAQEKYKHEHRGIGDLSPLVAAHQTYQEIAADQGAREVPDEDFMTATFTGIQEAVARKCGGVPVGCFRCEQPKPRYFAGSVWIRHDGDKHYLVFMDASGNCTEYRIWFCPFCGKKF